jgi:hypothetical protein
VTDEPNTSSETEEQPETSETEEQPDQKPELSEMEKRLRKANKEAEKYRIRLKEFEDAQKTEAEKLAEQKTAAEKDAAEARRELMRYRVAAEKGLPAEVIDRLKGDDEQEMAEDADRLLALLKPGRPRGDIDAGPKGGNPTESVDEEFGRLIKERLH